ncbi:MAG: site-specific integrase [Clostridiales bacterium]|nr:site-specific integrase [Clostridiales bacterium]
MLDSIIKPYFGQRYIPTISFHDIDEFIMSLKKQNFSNKKVNHVITTMKNIFNYAEMIGLIQTNPCKTFKPFKVNTPEKGILTREELQKLFSEENRGQIWPERIHYIFNYLAAHTGLRLGEILALRLIDFSNGKLNITHSFSPDSLNDGGLKSTKSGKSRVIPLDKKLGDLFKEVCQGKQHDQFIFSTSQGLRPMDHKAVYKRFYKALEAIGIDKAERKRRNITFHSYRHGVNTFFLEAGTPPETVRLILGHSGSAMTARYSHLQLPSIESLDVSSDCLKQDDSNHGTVPSYINDLIDMVLLYPDGKRVVKSLDAVALEIQKQNKQPTEKYLREMFLKPDGKQYSLRACKQAINYANFN